MLNNTVEFLDIVKAKLKNTFECYFKQRKKVDSFDFNMFISDDEFRQSILLIRKLAKQKGITLKNSFSGSRTVEEFLMDIYFENQEGYGYCLQDISSVFNEFSNYLEDNLYEIEIVKVQCDVPPDLTYQNIVRDLNNCEKRIADKDYAGAITSARTVVEGVCKDLLIVLGQNVTDETPSLPKLFNNLSKHLNLDSSNKKFDDSLKGIVSGLNKIIQGLTEVRNRSSDSHATKLNPTYHHAVLAVNSAKTVTSFLFHTYEFQKAKGLLKQLV